jgi:hypothetical protein
VAEIPIESVSPAGGGAERCSGTTTARETRCSGRAYTIQAAGVDVLYLSAPTYGIAVPSLPAVRFGAMLSATGAKKAGYIGARGNMHRSLFEPNQPKSEMACTTRAGGGPES